MKWALALLCLILLAPLALVDVPPLLDYPNHLARAVVLAVGRHPIRSCRACTRPIGRSSQISAPTLSCRRCCICCPCIWPAASLWASASCCRSSARSPIAARCSAFTPPWPLASGLVAYNATLLLGFLNFVAAIGIALLLAAGWIAWRERHPARTVALATVGAVALFFCHLMGLLFFFVLIAGHELEQLWLRRAHWATVPARLAALDAFARRRARPVSRVAARAACRENRIHIP